MVLPLAALSGFSSFFLDEGSPHHPDEDLQHQALHQVAVGRVEQADGEKRCRLNTVLACESSRKPSTPW